VLGTGRAVHADIVYLKDGTELKGRVIQTRTSFTDPATGMTFQIPAGDGVFGVYDGVRVVTFSRFQIDPSRPGSGIEDTDVYAKLIRLSRPAKLPTAKCPAGHIRNAPPFKENGERTVKVWVDTGGYLEVGQKLTFLSPYQMRIFSTTNQWVQNFLTSELDRETVISLAKNFPQIRDVKDPIEKRFVLYRFMVEAKWLDLASKELDSIEKDLPAAKERVEKSRASLRELEAEILVRLAQRALDSGQLQGARALLSRIPSQGLQAGINIRINQLRVKVDRLTKQYDDAIRFLRVLPDQAVGKCAETLCEAASVIRDELYLEALDRVEPFIDLARQAEQIKKAGGVPPDTAEQLLARAVSGWLMGREASDARPEVAQKLWKARMMAATYIQTPDVRNRQKLLALYQKDEPVEIEELARIIALLPPPQPDLSMAHMGIPADSITRKTNLPDSNRGPVDYEVLLPPEYQPGRPYPTLVVLHHDGETLKQTIRRYATDALQNGYILVAPEWGSGFGGAYSYSEEEQQHVLDAIRDLRLHYHVDTDRIFLSGFGEGGSAAWDVGLAHPDLFAAVVPIAGNPRKKLIWSYWTNAAHLPFYIVGGEMGGDSIPAVLKVMEWWINKGYECLNVMYQGRGMEWFGGELPNVFDWMNRRKRNFPFPELGHWPTANRETAMQTARPSDNHFYWLTADEINESNRLNVQGRDTVTASLQAIIRPGNKIEVSSFAVKRLTVWLSPSMIDFTKPVSIKFTGGKSFEKLYRPNGGKPLKPDLSVMMEDFLDRGDNTHLFVYKIPLLPQSPGKQPGN
jgi:pimeloyl-ACP methyl ester carboxylesterase